ncbi:MAG: ribosome silencing factor [Sulfuricella sp.]|nr:ribosome silencing factor [Sulfuricella sp.]
MKPEEMKQAAVSALEDIKARDIVVMDVRKLTSMTDYMIVASADSNRQTRALSDNVQKKLKALGEEVIGVEGEGSGEWVLVDLGAVVVHIMQPTIREYYNLEQLWGGPSMGKKAKLAEPAPQP